jgi:histidinol phosphatase-like enzyme
VKILFLDIDGVLNRVPTSTQDGKFYKPALINLEYLLNKVPDLKIVVSSAWRNWV